MIYCEICGEGDCCERADLKDSAVLCDTCYKANLVLNAWAQAYWEEADNA